MVQARKVPDTVQSELNRLRVRLRQTTALRGLGHLLLTGTGTLLAALVADFLFDFEAATRYCLLAGQLLLCVALCVSGVVRPLLRRLADEDIAAIAERKFPHLGERLTSLIELANDRLPESERGSALMREMLEQETITAVRETDLVHAIESRRAADPAITGVAVAAIGILWVLLFPEPSWLLLARLADPGGNYESASLLQFVITPEDCVVSRGSNVAITASIHWRDQRNSAVPEPVTVQWENDSGQTDQRELRFDADRDAFICVLTDARNSFRFRVAAGGARSKSVSVTVEEAPKIVTATLDVTPPDYADRPKLTYDGAVGEMLAFEHSKLQYTLTFNKPVKSAELEWLGALAIPDHTLLPVAANNHPDESATTDGLNNVAERHVGTFRNELVPADDLPRVPLTLSEDGRSASLWTSATVQGILAFRLAGRHGLLNSDEPFRQLKIERDQPPRIEVAGGLQDSARPSDIYPLVLAVTDDIGVEQLELRITSPDGIETIQTAPADKLGARRLSHRFRVNLAGLGVESGTVLRLQVRAADGRPLPCPNEVWSEARLLSVSDAAAAPGTKDLLANQEQLQTELRAIRTELQRATVVSDELRKQAETAAESDVPFLKAEPLSTLAQSEVEISERLFTLTRQLQTRPLFARFAAEIERTVRDELAPVAEQLLDTREQPPRQLAELLHRNGDATDLAAEQLREFESRFDRLAELEQDLLELNRIAERAGQLAVDAKRLSELRAELDTAQRQPESGPRSDEGRSTQIEADSPADNSNQSRNAKLRRLSVARSELAAAQQQLQAGHRDLAGELQGLLDRRPEVLAAARSRQLRHLEQIAERAERLASREELLAQAFQEDASLTVSKPVDASRPTELPGSDSRPRLLADEPVLDELIEQQRELSAVAAEIALAVTETQSQQSEARSAAIKSARLAVQSQQQAAGGRFTAAERLARVSAESARNTQMALANDQPVLATRAAAVATGQTRLAEAFERLQQSATRRSAARLAQQDQVQEAAGQLAEELNELAQSLVAEPIGMNGPAFNAETARQSAELATQLAQQAAGSFKDGLATEAAQAAQESATALRRTATSAGGQRPVDATAAKPDRPWGGESADDIPGELATQVVAAAQQLMQAQRQIGEAIVADEVAGLQGRALPGHQPDARSDQAEGSREPTAENQSPPTDSAQRTDGRANPQTTAAGKSKTLKPENGQPAQPADVTEDSTVQNNEASGGGRETNSSGGPASQTTSPASNALRRAAQALAQASELLSGVSQKFAPQGGQMQSEPGRGMSSGEDSQLASELGSDGAGAAGFEDADSPLELQLRQQIMRDWGRLPVKLRAEILQSSDRRTNGEYAEIIKLYFEQIAAEESGQESGNNGQRTGNRR